MTHMCYNYQRDIGRFSSTFLKICPLSFLFFLLRFSSNNHWINVLAICQGLEEFISCGIYHSHFTGLMCSHVEFSPLCVFKCLSSLYGLCIDVITRTRHHLSLQYIEEKSNSTNVHWWGFLAFQARTLGYCYGSQRNTI